MKSFTSRFPLLLTLVFLVANQPVFPASHSEAPLISRDSTADNTDVYAFVSPDNPSTVTLIANWIPLQAPEGGPNFYPFDPEVQYFIHVDNDGDAVEDMSFQFQFQNEIQNFALSIMDMTIPIPFINTGQIGPGNNFNLNVRESYTVNLIRGSVDSPESVSQFMNDGNGTNRFDKPVDNIGQKSIIDYETYAKDFVHDASVIGMTEKVKIFSGQRDDSFYVDLGGIFDLINTTDPTGDPDAGEDDLAGFNVSTTALQVPIQSITSDEAVIGVWASARRPTRGMGNGADTNDDGVVNSKDLINVAGNWQQQTSKTGGFVQVSRLGMPLVNEVVIGLPDKDRWNADHPKDDAQYMNYFAKPVLPLHIFFLTSNPAPEVVRDDLVQVFLTGIPGLNETPGAPPSDMIRLNTSIPPVPFGTENPLGVIGGDTAGFPNGRRLADDVVDIELRAGMGVLLPEADAPSGQLPWTDGVLGNDVPFLNEFPYLGTPHSGQSSRP